MEIRGGEVESIAAFERFLYGIAIAYIPVSNLNIQTINIEGITGFSDKNLDPLAILEQLPNDG